jgi:hypothetical protein
LGFAFNLDVTMGVVTVVSTAVERTATTNKNAKINVFKNYYIYKNKI